MALKLFGSLFIIFSVIGIGLSISAKERYRLDNMSELKKDINILISELLHNRATFSNAIKNINGELAIVFKEILKGIDNNNSVESSWNYSFVKHRNEIFFTKDDIESIRSIGKVFQSPDYTYQQRELTGFVDKLDNKINELEKKYNKNIKLYRSIYTAIAILIVVILF